MSEVRRAGNVPDAPLEDCRISVIGNKGIVAGSPLRDQFRRMILMSTYQIWVINAEWTNSATLGMRRG